MTVDNLISKNNIVVNGEIIADVSGTANKAIYDTKGRRLSTLKVDSTNTLYNGSYSDKKSKVTSSIIDDLFADVATKTFKVTKVDIGLSAVQRPLYANGKFITTSYNSNKIAYCSEEDMTKWTATTINVSNMQPMCYGNGKYIVANSVNLYYSTSLTGTYTKCTISGTTSASLFTTVYGNGTFVNYPYNVNSSQVLYSKDGINWKISQFPAAWIIGGMCYGNGMFVASLYQGTNMFISTDGINWTKSKSLRANYNWGGIIYGNGKFVCCSGNSGYVAYSGDGNNWKYSTAPLSNLGSIAYGNGLFVATADGGTVDTICYSTDGINWYKFALGESLSNHRGICYGNGKFFIIGNDSTGLVIE